MNTIRLEQLSLSEALSIEQVFQLQTRRCNTDTEHTRSNGQMYLQQFRSIIPSPAIQQNVLTLLSRTLYKCVHGSIFSIFSRIGEVFTITLLGPSPGKKHLSRQEVGTRMQLS